MCRRAKSSISFYYRGSSLPLSPRPYPHPRCFRYLFFRFLCTWRPSRLPLLFPAVRKTARGPATNLTYEFAVRAYALPTRRSRVQRTCTRTADKREKGCTRPRDPRRFSRFLARRQLTAIAGRPARRLFAARRDATRRTAPRWIPGVAESPSEIARPATRAARSRAREDARRAPPSRAAAAAAAAFGQDRTRNYALYGAYLSIRPPRLATPIGGTIVPRHPRDAPQDGWHEESGAPRVSLGGCCADDVTLAPLDLARLLPPPHPHPPVLPHSPPPSVLKMWHTDVQFCTFF